MLIEGAILSKGIAQQIEQDILREDRLASSSNSILITWRLG